MSYQSNSARRGLRAVVAQTPALILASAALIISLGGAAYAVSGPSGHSVQPKTTTLVLHPLPLHNGWTSSQGAYGTGSPTYGILNGFIYLAGSLHQSVPGSDIFAVLPVADRPSHNLYFDVYTNSSNPGYLYVSRNGSMYASSNVTCGSGNTATCFTSLAGVSWPIHS